MRERVMMRDRAFSNHASDIGGGCRSARSLSARRGGCIITPIAKTGAASICWTMYGLPRRDLFAAMRIAVEALRYRNSDCAR
jgi:hypothetical protein